MRKTVVTGHFLRRYHIQAGITNKTLSGFIHRVIANDVIHTFQSFCDFYNGIYVMSLQEILNRLALDFGFRGKIIASKEQGPHGAI